MSNDLTQIELPKTLANLDRFVFLSELLTDQWDLVVSRTSLVLTYSPGFLFIDSLNTHTLYRAREHGLVPEFDASFMKAIILSTEQIL